MSENLQGHNVQLLAILHLCGGSVAVPICGNGGGVDDVLALPIGGRDGKHLHEQEHRCGNRALPLDLEGAAHMILLRICAEAFFQRMGLFLILIRDGFLVLVFVMLIFGLAVAVEPEPPISVVFLLLALVQMLHDFLIHVGPHRIGGGFIGGFLETSDFEVHCECAGNTLLNDRTRLDELAVAMRKFKGAVVNVFSCHCAELVECSTVSQNDILQNIEFFHEIHPSLYE